MTINGINGTNTQTAQMGMNQATDSYSRNIQSQIANAQKQLQELSSNGDIPQEEKMKRRQEIQQQISDLNMQLRQHQMEQRRAAMNSAEQQAKGSAMDDMGGGANAKAGNKSAGLSQASMTAMISADSSIKQAKAHGSVATKMEGRSGILKSEIKLDQARGGDTQKKEGELAEVEQKAQAASSSQLSALADAGRTLEEAAKADSREERMTRTQRLFIKKMRMSMCPIQTQMKEAHSRAKAPMRKRMFPFPTVRRQPRAHHSGRHPTDRSTFVCRRAWRKPAMMRSARQVWRWIPAPR